MIAKDSPSKKRFWAAAVRWLAASSALIYALAQFFPGTPVPAPTIDGSWMQTLHVAFEQHWQFGRDIVFTFGPWGFLYGGYYPPTFVTSVIVWAMLAVVFWWAGWRLACHFSGSKLFSWFWLVGFIGLSGLVQDSQRDPSGVWVSGFIGTAGVPSLALATSILIAASSNNVLRAVYAAYFAGVRATAISACALVLLASIGIAIAVRMASS